MTEWWLFKVNGLLVPNYRSRWRLLGNQNRLLEITWNEYRKKSWDLVFGPHLVYGLYKQTAPWIVDGSWSSYHATLTAYIVAMIVFLLSFWHWTLFENCCEGRFRYYLDDLSYGLENAPDHPNVVTYWSKSEASVQQLSPSPPNVRQLSAKCPPNVRQLSA